MFNLKNSHELHHRINTWYQHHARDLPWRRADCTAWGVMVSEFMLQQTPVNRVLPVWEEWMRRWPTPASLAAEDSAGGGRIPRPFLMALSWVPANPCVIIEGKEEGSAYTCKLND